MTDLSILDEDIPDDVLVAVHTFATPFMTGPVPDFGSTQWARLADDDPGKLAAAVRAGMAWWHLAVFGAPAGWAERLDRHAAERFKSVAVDLSIELQREREVVAHHRDELSAALRRGDTPRVEALLDRIASWQWAEEEPAPQ